VTGKMRRTAELGADFWNDSCALGELGQAVENGAVGATSNPVIVCEAVAGDPRTWLPVLDGLLQEHPSDTEDELAWRLIEAIGRRAAALLEPVYERTGGRKGFLSMQVNPKLYRSAERMAEHARRLAAVAPNVAVKLPATEAGLKPMEGLVAEGINVNATVSFSVSQAVAVAETYERGLRKAEASGLEMARLHPYVTVMVGRVDDHLKRVVERDRLAVDPGALDWGGIAVFKRARAVFEERGCRGTLLAAAYRHVGHWRELIGPGVVLSMPYRWWRQFEASELVPERTLERPVDDGVLKELSRIEDFRRAYEPDAMRPEEFVRYGASVHTLNQFLGGAQRLVELVRGRLLAS